MQLLGPNECALFEVGDGFFHLFYGVQNEAPVLHHGFTEGRRRHEQRLGILVGGQGDGRASGEDGEAWPGDDVLANRERTANDIDYGRPVGLGFERDAGAEGEREVEDLRANRDQGEGAFGLFECARDDACSDTRTDGKDRDFGCTRAAVTGGHHLLGGWEVEPELEGLIPFRAGVEHFFVEDAAAGGHPLRVAAADGVFVAQAVFVGHLAAVDDGEGFDAAMGMTWKALLEVFGSGFDDEVIAQENGVEQYEAFAADAAAYGDSSGFSGQDGLDGDSNGAGLTHAFLHV